MLLLSNREVVPPASCNKHANSIDTHMYDCYGIINAFVCILRIIYAYACMIIAEIVCIMLYT
jgi:hypothetical protein